MKRGSSRRNLSVGLLLLVLLFACVVSHKFREGMESKEVEKRLDNMEDKLDDIYEEVVGEGIKTGRYVYHEDDGEYDDELSFILTKEGGNEYSFSGTIKEENIRFKLELFSDNSMLGKYVKNGDTDVIMSFVFDKSGNFFFAEKGFFVHVDYKEEFLEEVKRAAKGKKDGVLFWWDLIEYFDMKVYENEAVTKREEEMEKRRKKKIKD